MSRFRGKFWVLPASVVAALIFGLIPLPPWLDPLRPYWLALVLAYWLIEAPESIGLGWAFLLGVIADLLFGSLLGEQALRLTILAFILQRFRARIRFFPVSQQAVLIGALLLNDRVVTLLVHLMLGVPVLPARYWWSVLVGVVLWGPMFVLLDNLRLGKRGSA